MWAQVFILDISKQYAMKEHLSIKVYLPAFKEIPGSLIKYEMVLKDYV